MTRLRNKNIYKDRKMSGFESIKSAGVDKKEEESSDDEGLMGSIGFMFDNLHEKIVSEIVITDDIRVQIKTIGDQPGHKQSGQYLWPAAKAAATYLHQHWIDHGLHSSVVLELGAGCGVAGILTTTLPGIKHVVFSDYDMGTLSLISESLQLNRGLVAASLRSSITTFLEWGKYDSIQPDLMTSIEYHTTTTAASETTFAFSSSSLFPLIIGSDLIYCQDVVKPLFQSVQHFLQKQPQEEEEPTISSVNIKRTRSTFVLVSSFALGEVSILFM